MFTCNDILLTFLDVVTGLIHANHGGKIIEYLLQQLKNATTDVRFYSLKSECL